MYHTYRKALQVQPLTGQTLAETTEPIKLRPAGAWVYRTYTAAARQAMPGQELYVAEDNSVWMTSEAEKLAD